MLANISFITFMKQLNYYLSSYTCKYKMKIITAVSRIGDDEYKFYYLGEKAEKFKGSEIETIEIWEK